MIVIYCLLDAKKTQHTYRTEKERPKLSKLNFSNSSTRKTDLSPLKKEIKYIEPSCLFEILISNNSRR